MLLYECCWRNLEKREEFILKKKNNLIEEYEINPHTMAILPTTYGSKTYSEIMEIDNQFISPFKPMEIVKKSCSYFGSSYDGRKDGSKRLTGITHKAPIIVDPHTGIFLFPTTSPSNPQCIWISHEHVLTWEPGDNNMTVITFRNKQKLLVPMSIRSFDNQMSRTSRLRISFIQHIQYMDQKYPIRPGAIMHFEASEKRRPYRINYDFK